MQDCFFPEDELEEQRELINDQKFRLRGIIKAIQGLRDYIDGGLTDWMYNLGRVPVLLLYLCNFVYTFVV